MGVPRMPDRATVATGTGNGNGEVDGGSIFSKTNNPRLPVCFVVCVLAFWLWF